MSSVTIPHITTLLQWPLPGESCDCRGCAGEWGTHSSSSAEGPQFTAAFPTNMTVFVVVEFGFKLVFFYMAIFSSGKVSQLPGSFSSSSL